MDTQPQELWQKCLSFIGEKLPAEEFHTWFDPIRFVGYAANELVLGVPNSYLPKYVEKHFLDVYRQAIFSHFGAETQLRYTIIRDAEPSDAVRPNVGGGGILPATPAPAVKSNPQLLDPQLNNKYTFENFVKGESNKLALAVAMSIADNPGNGAFNPFFLYGPSGVGKTHLVNAIGVRIHERFPEKRVLFVSAHVFKVQYSDSYLHNTRNDFMHFYQTIDVLIIDDIQEITTSNTQLAFFHIFNHLQHNNKQIIITCDRPPVLFEGIEERMLTRFKWGMVAEMEKPDTRLRRDILMSKIRRDGLDFPAEVVQYIAQNVESSVRELEGIVNSIMAYSVVDNCEIDLPLTQRIVARAVNLEKKSVTASDITSAICKRYGLKQKDLESKSRKKPVASARQMAMYLCQKYTDMTLNQIGNEYGKRDHSTVLYACTQVRDRIGTDKAFRKEMEELENCLR